jgi:protein TonB
MFLRILSVAMLLAVAGGPAFTQTAKAPSSEAVAEFRYKAVSAVAQAVRYPVAACADGLEGSVLVGFVATSEGRITSRRIIKGSGHAVLDQEALQAIDRIKALPRFPAGAKGRQANFTVPLHFYVPRLLGVLKLPHNCKELAAKPGNVGKGR